MVKYKTIRQFAAESGYSEAAIRSKIREGVWIQDHVWRKAPDRRILISVEGYNEWVETGVGVSKQLPVMVKPHSRSRAGGLSPPPLI